MRVLLLGVGGFIGSHLVDRLLRDPSYVVEGLDLTDAKPSSRRVTRNGHITGASARPSAPPPTAAISGVRARQPDQRRAAYWRTTTASPHARITA